MNRVVEQTTSLPFGIITLMDLLNLWEVDRALAGFHSLRAEVEMKPRNELMDAALCTETGSTLKILQEKCAQLELNSTVDLIESTRCRCSEDDRMTAGELREHLDSLYPFLHSEASKLRFLRMTKEESGMFDNGKLFGLEVVAAFPSDETTYEIKEAGNCFALGRYTATVFHLMRVLEKGLKALADKLPILFSIPFEYQNWHNIIEQIEARIKDMNQQGASQQKTDDLKVYSEIAKEFRYFKDAWRNSVAHSRETYGREQALSISRHVGEFMRDIVKLGLHE